MSKSLKTIASEMSLEDLKRALAIKERLTGLEKRKGQLEKELASVDAEIKKLLTGKAAPRRKVAKKTVKAKKAARKTTKKVVKKAARKTAKKTTARKAAAKKPRVTVETVVTDLIRANGKPMPFQDILASVTKGKLIKTKSKNFANVLRRTLSTSKMVKRVGRGIYGVK